MVARAVEAILDALDAGGDGAYVQPMPAGLQNRRRTRVRRAAGFLVVGALFVALATGVIPGNAATNASATVQAQAVQEVRPLDTTELGLSRPIGIAYDPTAHAFVVAARGSGVTNLIRLTPWEESLGASRLPRPEPSTLTV